MSSALVKTTNPHARLSMGVRLCLEGLRAGTVNNIVDDAVFLGLRGVHDEVAFDVALNAVEGLAGVGTHQLVGDLPDAQDLAGVDVDVRGLSTKPSH